ncbi:MAG: general secretion pathway protein GspK [Desulfobacterales bacterium]|nr:general secretion pathway protein GspK [Desulfobacterales bacterium]
MLNNNKGIALLITLTIITVLVAVSFELNRQIRGSVSKAGVSRDMMTAENMIVSGVNIAEKILIRDKEETEIDSVQEDWADPEVINDYLRQTGLKAEDISLSITDELSRLQINALVQFPEARKFRPAQRKLWMRFFDLLLAGREPSAQAVFSEPLEPAMIINPVKDWLDSGDNDAVSGLTGAESDYYRGKDSPYACRNGPFRHISELLRVRNISLDLFERMEQGGNPGDFMTVHGMVPSPDSRHDFTYPGKININTAPMPVIAALLPAGQEFLASEVTAYREELAGGQFVHDLAAPNWYKNVPGMGDVEIDSDLITTQSDLFRLECTAKKNGVQMAATVLVTREKAEKTGKWQCRVLNWKYR